SGDDAVRRIAVAERLSSAPGAVRPARSHIAGAARLDLFRSQAEAVGSSLARVASPGEVPAAIADYLRSQNLAPRIRRGADARLGAMPWKSVPTLEVWAGPTTGDDPVGVSYALGGAAETGTVFVTSGADNPTTLNFLPETHIVVVSASDIEGSYEEMWQKLRQTYGKGEMPRTVNLISGPSRSGDIEQTILLGAHGPKRLHLIVVG
ncbi:MAG: lactate utilization protein, partial [Hyphomicrobiales bacterium]